MSRVPHQRATSAVWSIPLESHSLPFGVPRAAACSAAAQMRGRLKLRACDESKRLLPISVCLVPLLDPLIAKLDVLLEVRRPRLDDLRVVNGRIERRLFQRSEIAELLDVVRMPVVGDAPVEEQLAGIWIGCCVGDTGRIVI